MEATLLSWGRIKKGYRNYTTQRFKIEAQESEQTSPYVIKRRS